MNTVRCGRSLSLAVRRGERILAKLAVHKSQQWLDSCQHQLPTETEKLFYLLLDIITIIDATK